ncbi:MAG: hypothetical protein ABL983_06705 [Nitrospira sp.]
MGGNAIGKAMECWNLDIMANSDKGVDYYSVVGVEALIQAKAGEVKHGRTIGSSKDQEFADSLPVLVEMGIRLLYRINPLKQYAVVAAEEVFPQAGNSRLDVRVKQPDGRGIVFDYKVKFGEMEEKWLDKEFEKHFNGEQRLTYTTLTGTDMFGIILVVLKPRKDRRAIDPKIVVRTSPVTDQEKQVWLRDAQLMTPYMDHTLTIQSPTFVPGRPFPHASVFGDCKYSDACLRYALDPGMMALDYITIKKEG